MLSGILPGRCGVDPRSASFVDVVFNFYHAKPKNMYMYSSYNLTGSTRDVEKTLTPQAYISPCTQ